MTEAEFQFLSLEEILLLHELQLQHYGGASGLRDQNLLESALHMPQASFGGEFVHHGVFEMAAAYAFHIAENQPFVDGNKRTALAAALVFLDLNSVEINDPDELLYGAMIDIANKKLTKTGVAELLAQLAGDILSKS